MSVALALHLCELTSMLALQEADLGILALGSSADLLPQGRRGGDQTRPQPLCRQVHTHNSEITHEALNQAY